MLKSCLNNYWPIVHTPINTLGLFQDAYHPKFLEENAYLDKNDTYVRILFIRQFSTGHNHPTTTDEQLSVMDLTTHFCN